MSTAGLLWSVLVLVLLAGVGMCEDSYGTGGSK